MTSRDSCGVRAFVRLCFHRLYSSFHRLQGLTTSSHMANTAPDSKRDNVRSCASAKYGRFQAYVLIEQTSVLKYLSLSRHPQLQQSARSGVRADTHQQLTGQRTFMALPRTPANLRVPEAHPHPKRRDEHPCLRTSGVTKDHGRAFVASRALQHMLGTRKPEATTQPTVASARLENTPLVWLQELGLDVQTTAPVLRDETHSTRPQQRVTGKPVRTRCLRSRRRKQSLTIQILGQRSNSRTTAGTPRLYTTGPRPDTPHITYAQEVKGRNSHPFGGPLHRPIPRNAQVSNETFRLQNSRYSLAPYALPLIQEIPHPPRPASRSTHSSTLTTPFPSGYHSELSTSYTRPEPPICTALPQTLIRRRSHAASSLWSALYRFGSMRE